jgi:Ni/Co efflux regulator RcnB
MIRRFVTTTIATAFLTVAAAPMASAQDKQDKKEDKQTTSQRQKMKDCAAGWKDEKAKTEAKGRDAYRKFMSGCLKKQS